MSFKHSDPVLKDLSVDNSTRFLKTSGCIKNHLRLGSKRQNHWVTLYQPARFLLTCLIRPISNNTLHRSTPM